MGCGAVRATSHRTAPLSRLQPLLTVLPSLLNKDFVR